MKALNSRFLISDGRSSASWMHYYRLGLFRGRT